ncbi:hypothetical protein ACFVYF_37640 [Streptomyces sp. NPDC058274]|uniref:hypothetical protein n=1 Tax=Streptomyces sp. NPDC058274 TaxID=3346416 RepID=UPI0036F057F4
MPRRTKVGTLAPTAVAVTAAVAVLTGCGLQDHRQVGAAGPSASADPSVAPKAPLPSGKPLGADARVPSPSAVDRADATEVSRAWAETAYSYDTKYDTGPHDAMLRSVRWCTAKKAAAERAYRPAAGAGNDWNTWADHQAWTTVALTADDDGDAPSDTRTLAYRALFVEGTAHGRDGWTGTGPRADVFLKLVRPGTGKAWRVAEVTSVEAAVPPSAPASSSSPAALSALSSSTDRPE